MLLIDNTKKVVRRLMMDRRCIYVKGYENYVKIISPAPTIVYALTLKHFCARYPFLVRIHKQTAVDPNYIDYVSYEVRTKKAFVVLKSGVRLAISRRRFVWLRKFVASITVNDDHTA